MKIIVLGGDGFCGWPTALHLSNIGHDVWIVDNFSRRDIDEEMGTDSLTPIAPLWARLNAWHERTGNTINFCFLNLAEDFVTLLNLLQTEKPDAVIHFAEQRAAPYSMKDARRKRYTIENNTATTHNVLCAIVESALNVHLIHLGSMGVYGYGTAGAALPEGYLDFPGLGPVLYPANPGSVYHLTKTMDALMFAFYARNDALRITDLHQGVVWGTHTAETLMDEKLINRFDYDGDYGTVLNRFLMQAAVGHPLTVYGTGGQTRAFIHIRDTVRCIALALANPPARGDRVKIFNQMTETHRVRDLAVMVADLTRAEIVHLPNPRAEAEENTLFVDNRSFLNLGLNPTTLHQELCSEIIDVARRYRHRCDRMKILCTSLWRKT